jgi:hypothetical protein
MNHEKQKIEKRIRKLRLKSELCSIETEELQETDREYAIQFSKDFELEILFLEHKKKEQSIIAAKKLRLKPKVNNQEKTNLRQEKTKSFIDNDGLKKLHKQLAFELHPDRSKKDNHQDFLELQTAWDNKEYDKILDISLKLEVNLLEILDQDSINEMEKRLMERERNIQSIKRSVRWVWCQSNKNNKLRSFIRKSLGVKDGEFESWLLSKPEMRMDAKETGIETISSDDIGSAGSSRKALS